MAIEDYELGHADDEIRRQRLQSRLMQPLTETMLDAIGVGEGQIVVDIGCGPGDVSFLLADRVGPKGRVIGIDLGSRAIGEVRRRAVDDGRENVEFYVSSEDKLHDLPELDVLVGRLVLIHQADPLGFLRLAASRVKQGVRRHGKPTRRRHEEPIPPA